MEVCGVYGCTKAAEHLCTTHSAFLCQSHLNSHTEQPTVHLLADVTHPIHRQTLQEPPPISLNRGSERRCRDSQDLSGSLHSSEAHLAGAIRHIWESKQVDIEVLTRLCARSYPNPEEPCCSRSVAWAFNSLGIALHREQRYEEAAGAYQQSISMLAGLELDTQLFYIHYNLGLTLYEQRDYTGAIATYQKAAAAPNGIAKALIAYNFGRAWLKLGYKYEAIRAFITSVNLYRHLRFLKQLADSLYKLGCAFQDQKLHERAAVIFREANATYSGIHSASPLKICKLLAQFGTVVKESVLATKAVCRAWKSVMDEQKAGLQLLRLAAFLSPSSATVKMAYAEGIRLCAACANLHILKKALNATGWILAITCLARSKRMIVKHKIRLARQVGDPICLATALYYEGILLHAHGVHNKAIKAYDESESIFRDLALSSELTDVLVSRSIANADSQRNYTTARICEDAVTISRNLGLKEHNAHAQYTFGKLRLNNGQYNYAIPCYHAAAELFAELDLKTALATVLIDLATCYNKTNKSVLSASAYREAVVVCKLLSMHQKLARVLYTLSNTLRRQDCYEEAICAIEESVVIYQRLHMKSETADALVVSGVCYSRVNKCFDAIHVYNKAISIYEELECKRRKSNTLYNLAILFRDSNKYSEAIYYYQQSAELYQELEMEDDLILTLLKIGTTFDTKGSYAEAIRVYQEAASISSECKIDRYLADIYAQLGSSLLKVGCFTEAIEALERVGAATSRDVFGARINAIASLGFCYQQLGQLETATEQYQKCAEISKYSTQNYSDCLLKIGMLLDTRGLFDQAQEAFETRARLLGRI